MHGENPAHKIWDRLLDTLSRWTPLGMQVQKNGTRLIGRVPHVAPVAWLHEVYRGLDTEELEVLEQRLGARLPDDYRSFLAIANGLNAFSDRLKLFGAPRGGSRMSLATREPYDLALETLHTRATPDLLCFGGIADDFLYGRWRADGMGEVLRCPKSQLSQPTHRWPSFWQMLEAEVGRLASEFDLQGRRVRDPSRT